MNIEDQTIEQIRELTNIIGSQLLPQAQHGAIGKKCIIRTYASGVHFGEVVSVASNDGRSRCELKNARRLWRWSGGLSLSEIAVNGIKASDSKVCTTVEQHFIEDVIEFIPASETSIKTIEAAEDYET